MEGDREEGKGADGKGEKRMRVPRKGGRKEKGVMTNSVRDGRRKRNRKIEQLRMCNNQ